MLKTLGIVLLVALTCDYVVGSTVDKKSSQVRDFDAWGGVGSHPVAGCLGEALGPTPGYWDICGNRSVRSCIKYIFRVWKKKSTRCKNGSLDVQ